VNVNVTCDKTQKDAGGDPGILRGGWTAFPGWQRRVSLPEILKNLIRDPAMTPLGGGVQLKYILHVGEL
jgi:hypothetical protein